MGANLSFLQSNNRNLERKITGTVSESIISTGARAGEEHLQLIPGLPNELAYHILARVPRRHHTSLKLVCPSWNRVFKSTPIYQLRKQLAVTEEWLYILMKDADDQLVWYALDPETGQWKTLPPMPISIQEEEAKAEMGQQQGSDSLMKLYGKWMIRVIFGDRIRLKGCSAAALDGCLFVVGGCLRAPLDSVWRYDARTETWSTVRRMDTARAFCKTACLHNKLYAIGGVQLGVQDGVYPIQSAEVYDPTTNQWSPAGMFCFSRKDSAASTAHMSKPMATSVVSYNHKLCLSHSLYSQYVNVGGEVYEPMANTWSKMPRGMVDGWPAPQLGTKLNTVVNGEMVALDPTNSLDGVRLKLYDNQNDEWKIVCTRIPISFDLVYPDSPCVVAGFKTKLYSVTKEYNGSVSVLCVDLSSLSDCDVKVWKTIASRSFGFVKLVTCQVLDI